eukprot:TRINITY_DN5329_c0_g1_i1.p1 TRINITY_DN5329_c0_g1~~TRINITY_DN5329_c0_g1_i1.p1  ORF type:complete len:267 (+),score=43.78 TRINITY_DN5329_c0_g1_i1:79-879(+)
MVSSSMMLRSAMALFLGPVFARSSEACDEVPESHYTSLLEHKRSLLTARASRAQVDAANSVIPDTAFCNAEQGKRAKYWAARPEIECDPRAGLEGLEVWSKGWAGGYCALNAAAEAYEDPKMRTAPGVFLWDAEYCLAAGLVDVPLKQAQLHTNFTAVLEKTSQICASEPIQLTLASSSEADMAAAEAEISALLEKEQKLPVHLRKGFMRDELFLRQAALQCKQSFLSCMVHFCSFNYCSLADGSVGMGCQCHDDWDLRPIPAGSA